MFGLRTSRARLSQPPTVSSVTRALSRHGSSLRGQTWEHFRFQTQPMANVKLFSTTRIVGKPKDEIIDISHLPQGQLPPLAPIPSPNEKKKRSRAKRATKKKIEEGEEQDVGLSSTSLDEGEEAIVTHAADNSEPPYPTVILQAYRTMQKYANCVLLTRVGGFYELYLRQAEEVGPLLNLKVAQKRTQAGPVAMSGFPFFQLERFLKILVQDLRRHVAIADEFPLEAEERAANGGLLHDRRVTRIVTPGTLIDEHFIDPLSSNYALAIYIPPSRTDPRTNHTPEKDPDLLVPPSYPPPSSPNAPETAGLAWLDLSTGQFFTQDVALEAIPAALSRIGPREVVLEERYRDVASSLFGLTTTATQEDRFSVTYTSTTSDFATISDWGAYLEDKISPLEQRQFTEVEVGAGSLLLQYVRDRLQGIAMKLQKPCRQATREVMSIDKNSFRSLEIKKTIRDGAFRGTLLHAIRRTVTKSGTRLLTDWLTAPSTSLPLIAERQRLVSRFLEHDAICENIVLLLKTTHDSQRLLQRFSLNRGHADDLMGLAATIKATREIANALQQSLQRDQDESTRKAEDDVDSVMSLRLSQEAVSALLSRFSLAEPMKLAKSIEDAIDIEGVEQQHEIEEAETKEMIAMAERVVGSEGTLSDASDLLPRQSLRNLEQQQQQAPPTKLKKKSSATSSPTTFQNYYGQDNEIWVMKPSASRPLARLHRELAKLHAHKEDLTQTLRERFSDSSLELKWRPNLGYLVHVKGRDLQRSGLTQAADFKSLSTSRTTGSFHHSPWSDLGQSMDDARNRIRQEERRIFHRLRDQVIANLVRLRQNATILDEIDITTSFARLAREQSLVAPHLNLSTAHHIVQGQHPTVARALFERGQHSFTRNDCFVGDPACGHVWLITGPNMAGKSTFLRQTALITIMAQVGCFVPAESARIGIVDAIFSRVGSADNLYEDQSTFMVEMLETAYILRTATRRSFVIMDEVGRGTTADDGTALAYASLVHLARVCGCRTLFATHFHRLADLARLDGLLLDPPLGATVDRAETLPLASQTSETTMVAEESSMADTAPPPVALYCTDVIEDGHGHFHFDHRMRPGLNRQSHALKVAQLAGLPPSVLDTARRVMNSQRET